MKLRRLACGTLAVAFAVTTLGARADCPVVIPTVWAKAKLLSCQAFTVHASTLKMSDLADQQPPVYPDAQGPNSAARWCRCSSTR